MKVKDYPMNMCPISTRETDSAPVCVCVCVGGNPKRYLNGQPEIDTYRTARS